MTSVGLKCPGLPGWVALPLAGDEDSAVWALARTAADSAGLESVATSVGPDAAAAMLAATIDRARSLWDSPVAAPVSFALQPDPLGPVLAVLDAALFPFEDVPFSAERMTALHGPATGPISQETVDTTMGPAERFRGFFAAEPRDVTDSSASFAVIEATTYVVMSPDLDGYLWVDAQWHDVGLGDAIAAQVEQMVNLMVVEVTS